MMQVCPGLGYQLSLRSVLPDAKLLGIGDIRISGCTCDSRRIEPGWLFVAVEGGRHDGREFLAEAAANGALAVLSNKLLAESPIPCLVVPDPRAAFGYICHALKNNPSQRLKVVGITGTNGKTTTACLIAGVLTAAEHKVGLLGTLGYLDGKEIADSKWTTPPADEIAAWLSRMVNNGCSHAVMEVSSHALDQARVAGIHFNATCFTNVTHDHLDYHESIYDYRMVKSKLLDYLPAEGLAVINADDPVSASYLSRISGPVLTVGIRSAAEITAVPIEQCLSEQTFLLTAGSQTIPVRTQMIGQHHIYNCLIAAAVGLSYGIDLPTIARGLESVAHVPGRLERIECGQPFGVFVDFAHTPDALTASLQALQQVTSGQLICVFGAGGDRDRTKRPWMGRAVELAADAALITSDNPRSEDPAAIAADILSGLEHPEAAQIVLDRTAAIREALAMARPGDTVLIAGKGHENYQILEDRRIELDDCQVARGWLYDVQPYAEP